MRRTVILVLMIGYLLSPENVAAQLNTNATQIKEKHGTDYEQGIRKHAVDEWGTDYQMIVYVINQQADAIFDLIGDFKSEHSQILHDAIVEWSASGKESHNRAHWKKIGTVNLESLVGFRTDWQMVKYVYDNQVKAKSSF